MKWKFFSNDNKILKEKTRICFDRTHTHTQSIFKQSCVRLNVIYNPWSNSSNWHRYLKSLHYRLFHQTAIWSNVWISNPCAYNVGPKLCTTVSVYTLQLVIIKIIKLPKKVFHFNLPKAFNEPIQCWNFYISTV